VVDTAYDIGAGYELIPEDGLFRITQQSDDHKIPENKLDE
jgi:hypothetical protein